ncbi:MAG: uracil phosphoribosyltransferase [Bacteroidales bacterium]
MAITILNQTNSVFNTYLAESRDSSIQANRQRFRLNLERMGAVIAYEISKTLACENREIQTPLGIAMESVIVEQPVLMSILRAGLPVHQGMLQVFDKADNGFISTFRHYEKDRSLQIHVQDFTCPDVHKKVVILSDAMLASGQSLVAAFRAIIQRGDPQHVHLVSVVASREGLNYLRKRIPSENVSIWIGALDDELTVKSYIVPGLGDAGDLAYGEKPEI